MNQFIFVSLLLNLKKSQITPHITEVASRQFPGINSTLIVPKNVLHCFIKKFIFDLSKYMAVDIMKILSKKSLVAHKYCTMIYIAVYIQPEKPSVYCRDQYMPLKAFCEENFYHEEF